MFVEFPKALGNAVSSRIFNSRFPFTSDLLLILPTIIPIHRLGLLRELHDPVVPGLWECFLAVAADGFGGLGDAAEDAEQDIDGCVDRVVLLCEGSGDAEPDLPIEGILVIVAVAVWGFVPIRVRAFGRRSR